MDKIIEQKLKECEEFIENSTTEELIEYHKSLNINYEDYKEDFGGRVIVDWCGNELNKQE